VTVEPRSLPEMIALTAFTASSDETLHAAVAQLRADLEAGTAEVERLYARWQELEAIKAR